MDVKKVGLLVEIAGLDDLDEDLQHRIRMNYVNCNYWVIIIIQ